MPEPTGPYPPRTAAPVCRLPAHELTARRRRKRNITQLPAVRQPPAPAPEGARATTGAPNPR